MRGSSLVEKVLTTKGDPLELYTHLGAHVFQFVAHVDAEEGQHECCSKGYPLKANRFARKMSPTVRFTLCSSPNI